MGRIIALASLCLLSGLLASTQANAASAIKVCHERADYTPFIVDDGEQSGGLLIDLVSSAARDSGVLVEFYSKSWEGCKSDVRKGRAQALFAMIHTPKRAERYAFPPKEKLLHWYLWLAQYPVFTHKDVMFDPKTYSVQYGIGAPFGYVAHDMLKQKDWLSPIQYTPREGLNMLAHNKLDGYVVERFIGQKIIEQLEIRDDVKMQEFVLLSTRWHLAFNKKYVASHKELIHKLWKNIAKVRNQLTKTLQEKSEPVL